jgi:outer membrane receptor protein involved in Fe transport
MMKKMKRRKLSLAVAQVLGAGAVVGLAAPMAYAQTTAATPETIQKIQVTGSRIPLQTLESESPVQIITQQDIQMTGLTNIADVLNQLPQVFVDFGQNLSNGSFGTSTVDLRGLGVNRTLVLIDGRRLPAGDPRSYPTDLNAIPSPLVQRVDVLTGGASSIYGSDAIAGVVNFIMNDHFEGVQFQWNGNAYTHNQGDDTGVSAQVALRAQTNPSQFAVPGNVNLGSNGSGYTQDFNFVLGGNFAGGKGNATVYFEYRHSNPVLQSTRDFSACSIASTPTGFVCSGSSTSYPGRFFDANTGKSWTIADSAGTVRPFAAATDQFNFGPYNYFQVPDTRYLANFFAHYDALPNVRVYTEFDFMDSTTVLQIAPSGSFFGTDTYTVANTNPFLSPSFKAAFGITPTNPGTMLIGRRNIEGGGRQDEPRHTQYRVVIGAKGTVLDDKWDWDAWWQSGKVVYQDTYLNDFSRQRLLRALNVTTNPANGQPVCQSVLDGTDPNCVPYNIFQQGGVTQAALNYLQTPGFQSGETDQSVVGIHVSSDLGTAYGWKLPAAKSGIGVAFGYERRVEKDSFNTDAFFSIPDGSGQGSATIGLAGQYTVNEGFAEVRVPIADGQPWADTLSVNASYRYSSYSTNQTTNTYGLGAEWAPVKMARLRGTYQRAVRAANVIELFAAQGNTLFNMTNDPCGPTKSATLAQCVASGLNPAQYGAAILDNPAQQYNSLTGGNVALSPEKSDSYTFGIVLQPLRNFSATVDYWNIKVTNVIGTVGAALSLNQCLFANQFCNLIHRDPNFSSLWLGAGASQGFITNTNQNLGSLHTDGIDLTLNYLWDIDKYGGLNFNFIGTYVNQFEVEPVPGLGSYNCAGLFGVICGGPTPRWKSKFNVMWNTPWSWSAGLTWRYINSVNIDASSGNPLLSNPGGFNPVDMTLGTRNYIDLVGQWNINKNFTVRLGVNNIFDKDPPLVSPNGGPAVFYNGNTFPQVYDTMGRNWFLNVTAKF